MKKHEKKAVWNPCSIIHESCTRMEIQRRSVAFQALDPENKSMRFSMMLNEALGNSSVRNQQIMRAF